MTGDAAALGGLVRDWGRFYLIGYSGNLYHAQRRDNGARVHEADPVQLRREVEADYRAQPVLLPPSWDRAAWEARVSAAGLSPGALATALVLGRQAGAQGEAAPGAVVLASLSGCSRAPCPPACCGCGRPGSSSAPGAAARPG